MEGQDNSLEDRLNPEEFTSEKPERPKKERRPLPGWARKARNGAIAAVLVAGGLTGMGLYLSEKWHEKIEANPGVQFVETLKDIGQGIGQDFEDFGNYVSSWGFVQGVQKFVDEKVVVPYNTIVVEYGNPVNIPLTSEVFVATDTYMNLRIDKSTNKFFGDLFKVVPETALQYNGKEPVIIYDIDESVTPPAVEEKTLAPGEKMTIQGVSVIIEPRLSTGNILLVRESGADIKYDFDVAYTRPENMAPLKEDCSLEELAAYLTELGQRGIEFSVVPSVRQIDIDTTLGVNLGMPDVTVDQLAITDSRYKSDALHTFDQVTQDMWYAPQLMGFDKLLDWLSNFKGQVEAFRQIYMNIPRWTEEARAMPGNEDLPIAVFKTISSPTSEIREVPMPEYFPSLWKETTEEEITSIYLEMVKLTVNAGVNPPSSCSSDIERLEMLMDKNSEEKGIMDKYSIGVQDGCMLNETFKLLVSVPEPYVAPLQEKVDAYLEEMKKTAQPGGIDYNSLVIEVRDSN